MTLTGLINALEAVRARRGNLTVLHYDAADGSFGEPQVSVSLDPINPIGLGEDAEESGMAYGQEPPVPPFAVVS